MQLWEGQFGNVIHWKYYLISSLYMQGLYHYHHYISYSYMWLVLRDQFIHDSWRVETAYFSFCICAGYSTAH